MSKKKLNKTVWYGSDIDSQGNAILPPLAEGREDLNGIHEGEIYLHNQDDDPGIWVRTNKGNIKRIGFNKQDLDLSEYLKKQVWDTAWELRTTEEGESYIFCKLPFISQYGITLYTDGGNIDLPSLYAGIPVDEATITKREDGTLMLNPNLELGGLDEEALQKYLDDYNYAKKSDIPSLDGYAKITDVDSRINDLVNGAPQAYDTLKEIADVLQGNVNSIGDIITTLGTKADKTYVDTELAKYIPIAGDTEVTGNKNFLAGLKVGGLPISKYEGYDDVIYIDANVVLRGGLTQYAVDPVTIPSIIESLPQAGYEAKGVASFSDKYFVIDANGKVSIIPDSVGLNEEELEAWLANSDYTTKTYVDETFATKSSLNATNTEVAKKWTQDNDKIANWDTAYGWGNHASAGYFLASNFTKANIVAKLGISDWALAATKPSYTTKEVTEDTNLYFTNQRAIDALTETLKAYVTLKGTQTIEGEKNFTGGLKVNGSPIVYDSENGYWLFQGNLLITGGLTQYVDDGSVDLPNLYDALPIDGSTIYWDNGVLKAKVAEGGITSITDTMIIDALGYTPYDASNPNGYITSAALNDYQTKITSTNKLAYSLISGTPDLSVYLTTSSASSTYQPKITSSAKLAASLVSGLATVATSGSYNDLSNKPTIPTNTNQLTNGAGFITSSGYSSGVLDYNNTSAYIKVGYTGAGLTASNASHLAAYGINAAGERVIKDMAKSEVQAWLGLGSNAYNSTAYLPLSGGTITGNLIVQTHTVTHELYPSADDTYILGQSSRRWSNLYTTLINGYTPVHSGNIGSQSVASATKLQTARTIWGQSFDGTGNITGQLNITGGITGGMTQGAGALCIGHLTGGHIMFDTNDIQAKSNGTDPATLHINDWGGNVVFCSTSGSVGIGVLSPAQKFHVAGTIKAAAYRGGNIAIECDSSGSNNNGGNNGNIDSFGSKLYLQAVSTTDLVACYGGGNFSIGTLQSTAKLDVYGAIRSRAYNAINSNNAAFIWDKPGSNYTGMGSSGITDTIYFGACTEAGAWVTTHSQIWKFGGNILATGGITQYSDIRKKTKLQDVELTLKQVADAPLIEHYYNSDDKKTTHVGSIAQYWAELNDWFCKLDSDGFYTMEIQNAALASAISIARELQKYESKTDRTIRLLKKRINQLEDEIEILKKGA